MEVGSSLVAVPARPECTDTIEEEEEEDLSLDFARRLELLSFGFFAAIASFKRTFPSMAFRHYLRSYILLRPNIFAPMWLLGLTICVLVIFSSYLRIEDAWYLTPNLAYNIYNLSEKQCNVWHNFCCI